MGSSMIEKYKAKKKKDLVDYSKILEKVITLETNSLWKNTREFSSLCKIVVDFFVDNYYFENNINRKDPIEYSNDNINSVLASIIEGYKQIKEPDYMITKKNETFLLAVIVCSATYIDIAANVIDGEYISLKNKIKKLLKYFNKTKILKVYVNDKITLNNMFDLIKKNMQTEEKFFDTFKNLSCRNEYQLINKDNRYYKVRFIYKIDGIDNYDYNLILKYKDEYVDKYLNISYELLAIMLLKENLLNKKVNTYLLPITDSILEKDNSLKVLDDDLIKRNIAFILPLNRYRVNIKNIKKYQKQGFKFIYRYDDVSIDIFNDLSNIVVICNKDFMDKNRDELTSYMSKNIKFLEETLGKSVTDDIILKEIV